MSELTNERTRTYEVKKGRTAAAEAQWALFPSFFILFSDNTEHRE